MDCDTHGVDNGCKGGMPHLAFEWVINNTITINNTKRGGLTSEQYLPYTGMQDPTCPIVKGVATLSNWTTVSTNETEIAMALATIGPLSAGINQIGMEHYRG